MSKHDYTQVGQRIKMLRKRKGMNQSELAAALDKSLRTIQKYETCPFNSRKLYYAENRSKVRDG